MNKGIIITGSGREQILVDTETGKSEQVMFDNFDCYVYQAKEDLFVATTKGQSTTAKSGDYIVKIWCKKFLMTFPATTPFVDIFNEFTLQQRLASKSNGTTISNVDINELPCNDAGCCESIN